MKKSISIVDSPVKRNQTFVLKPVIKPQGVYSVPQMLDKINSKVIKASIDVTRNFKATPRPTFRQ